MRGACCPRPSPALRCAPQEIRKDAPLRSRACPPHLGRVRWLALALLVAGCGGGGGTTTTTTGTTCTLTANTTATAVVNSNGCAVLTRDVSGCTASRVSQGLSGEHSEPYSITQDDSNFVGVMRDGYPVYGRRDPSGMVPTDLDAFGGHTSVTVDSPSVAVYHDHVNLQTSTSAGTLGQQQWFLTKGTFRGTPGACTGCI